MLASLIHKASSALASLRIPTKENPEPKNNLTFVTVIYDDWHRLRHPIGIVHEIKTQGGQCREIFTFCCKGLQQPEMALFVKKRDGDLASNLVLNHDENEKIPTFLKKLPNDYKNAHFAAHSMTEMAMAV